MIKNILCPEQGQLPSGQVRKKKKLDPLETATALVLIIAILAVVLIAPHYVAINMSRRVTKNKNRRVTNVNHPHPADPEALRSNNPNSSSAIDHEKDQIARDCLLRLQNLDAIVAEWDPTNNRIRNNAKTWFDGYLNTCTSNTQSKDLFVLLRRVFLTLLSAKGLSKDGELVCGYLPALAKKLVRYKFCISGTIKVTEEGDSEEVTCARVAYKATFAKIREYYQHEACTRNLDGIKSLISTLRVEL